MVTAVVAQCLTTSMDLTELRLSLPGQVIHTITIVKSAPHSWFYATGQGTDAIGG